MALDGVPNFQVLIGAVLEHGQIDVAAHCVDDVLGTWVVIGASVHEFPQVGLVVLCYDFRHSKVLRNFFGHTELVQSEVGVWRNDCSG